MVSLGQLLVAYPWLRLLGEDVLPSLDVDELVEPHPAALRLGPTVVAYRRGAHARPGRISLCAVVPAARINSTRAADLAEAERANPGIVLVEYAPEATQSLGGLPSFQGEAPMDFRQAT